MATQTLFLSGTIKWAKGLAEPDKDYNNYNAQFYPDEKSLAEFKSAGSATKIKDSEDGPHFKIKRDVSKVIKGETVNFGPPRVFMADTDEDVDPRTVGNGSAVTVKLEVYDTSFKTKGTRLQAVRVDNIIVYEPEVLNDEVPF